MNSYQRSEIDRFKSDTMLYIISNPNNLDELEKDWEYYNSMPKDHKAISDAKSVELFGKTNKERYESLKSHYLKHDNFDIEDVPLEEGYIKEEVEDDVIRFEDIKYPTWAGEAADRWSVDAMRAIIRPVDSLETLEDLWRAFNDMPLKARRESDWKSMDLFGINNKTHYEFLKSKFLKQDIKNKEDLPIIDGDLPTTSEILPEPSPIEEECRLIKSGRLSKLETAKRCLKLSNIKDATYCENILIQSTLNDTIELFKDNVADTSTLIDDLPWFNPDEMEHLGVFDQDSNKFCIEPDNNELDKDVTVREWFENYKLLYSGIYTENTAKYTRLWISKLQELYLDYDRIKDSGDIDKINARKQSILELGWNPDFDFNIENRLIATKRIKDMYDKNRDCIDIIDMTHFNPSEEFDSINEISESNPLYPIFIVLVEGSSMFSAAIKKFTNGPFSHAAISFDAKLDKMYSYNINEANGFAIENVKEYNKNGRLGVFSIFVKERDLRKIRKMLDYYIDNKDKTAYSALNVITLPLNIPVEFDLKMICSQFVDRILKVANIDITHKTSSLVNPNSFFIAAEKNKKIYKMYDGKAGEYKSNRVNRILNSIKSKANYIKEFTNIKMNESTLIDYVCENSSDLSKLISIEETQYKIIEESNRLTKELLGCIIPQIEVCNIQEAKSFPIQFDDDGNLFIKSINKLDFEAEYAKSHKLLMTYDKSNDIDGMKYELSRLWFMNNILEKRLHSSKFKSKKEEYNKARAKILNDFNKYLDIVAKKEKSFNFAEYYENSPFSDASYKINRSTLKYSGELLKSIIMK